MKMEKCCWLLLLALPLFSCTSASSKSSSSLSSASEKAIVLDVDELTLSEGKSYQLHATSNKKNALIFYSVNDETIASVSSTGLVRAIKEGGTVISVQVGQDVALCALNVTPYEPDPALSLTLGKTSLSLNVGDVYLLPLSLVYGKETITDYALTAAFQKEGIVSLAEKSLSALKTGETEILLTATYNGMDASALARVSVYAL